MAIQLSDNLQSNSPKLLDAREGPFLSVSEAVTSVLKPYRKEGLSAFIFFEGKVVEYWYEGGIEDANLVPKTSGTGDINLSAYALAADYYTKLQSDERFAAILHFHSIGEISGLAEQIAALIASINQRATTTYVDNSVSTTRQDLQAQIDAFQSGLLPQPPVATFADIATTYPDPELNWLVVTEDTGYQWRYNGTTWELWSTSTIPIATTTNDGRMAKERVIQLNDHEERITALENEQDGASGILGIDIPVFGITPNTIGVNPGETLVASTTITEAIRRILQRKVPASYAAPTITLTKDKPSVQMVGTSVNVTLTGAFSQNDAGSLTIMRHLRDGTQFSTGNPATYNNLLFTAAGSTQFVVRAEYNQGPIKQVNGEDSPNGRIEAGTIDSSPQTITAVFPWMYGSTTADNVTPSEIFAAAKVVEIMGGSLQVPTFGTGPRRLWFAVPQGSKTFTKWQRSVLDAGAIGGSSNLFRNAVTVAITSVGLAENWTRNYDLYLGNYQTEASTPTTLS